MANQEFEALVQQMRAFQESRALLTAVELDLFTHVGSGETAPAVASKAGADARATEMLLNVLVSLGALEKQNGVFRNTPVTARFLSAGSPDNARAAMMHTVHMWDSWNTLTEAVRAGTTVGKPGIEASDRGWIRAFIAAMHRGVKPNAEVMVRAVGAAGVRRLLDIGGGSGGYSIAFARANPELHAEVFDLAEVVPLTKEYVADAGLSDRVTTRVGDLRKDEFGQDYDLILLSAICHMLSEEENRDLFRRCRRALAPHGRVVIREFVLNDDKTGPRPATLFALNMLVATRGGSSYSEAEYRAWLQDAGFAEVMRPIPNGDLLIAY